MQTYTLSVLAQMGFLPGYGDPGGQITANIERAWSPGWKGARSFQIQRPTAIAVREYVPGNLVYANGGRYGVSFYQLKAPRKPLNPMDIVTCQVLVVYSRPPNNKVAIMLKTLLTTSSGFQFMMLKWRSRLTSMMMNVSDSECQLKLEVICVMSIVEGNVFEQEKMEFKHLFGQGIRLVNIGPANLVSAEEPTLGYPLCRVCGATRSPDSHENVLNHFKEMHTKSCGKEHNSMP